MEGLTQPWREGPTATPQGSVSPVSPEVSSSPWFFSAAPMALKVSYFMGLGSNSGQARGLPDPPFPRSLSSEMFPDPPGRSGGRA